MKAKTYSRREFAQMLNHNGYELVRCKGSHFIYKKAGETVVVPKTLNKLIGRRLVREHGLVM